MLAKCPSVSIKDTHSCMTSNMFVSKWTCIYKLQNVYWWYYSKDWKCNSLVERDKKSMLNITLSSLSLNHSRSHQHLDFHKSYLNHMILEFHELKLHLPSTYSIHFGELCVLSVIWFMCVVGQFHLKIAQSPPTPNPWPSEWMGGLHFIMQT